MLNRRIHPEQKINLNKFKKTLLKKMEDNMDDYQVFRMSNKNDCEYILLKKNSIQYKILTNILRVNDTVYLNNFNLLKKKSKVLKL